jgi:hypothetical protein
VGRVIAMFFGPVNKKKKREQSSDQHDDAQLSWERFDEAVAQLVKPRRAVKCGSTQANVG